MIRHRHHHRRFGVALHGVAIRNDVGVRVRGEGLSARKRSLAQACGITLLLGGTVAERAGASAPSGYDTPSARENPSLRDGSAQVDFDPALLKQRGLDPTLADYFRHAPRFPPGPQNVELVVNGVIKGRAMVRFDQDGQVCFNRPLMVRAGLRPPGDLPVPDGAPGTECELISGVYPELLVRLSPGKEQVALIVAAAALLPDSVERRGFSSGGAAALLNYDALVMQSRHEGASLQFRSVRTEVGLNVAGWALRSRQSYTSVQGNAHVDQLYTYASRTWERAGAHVQIGQLTSASPLHALGAFTGIQIQPEAALAEQARMPGASISGVAFSPSRVEVRQSGVLVHTTLVPGGPFSLDDLALLNRKLDLDVTVIEESGAQQRFSVPAASLQAGDFLLGAGPRYFLAAGKVRRLGNYQGEEPAFVTADKGWRIGKRTEVSAGIMLAENYSALGWSLQQRLGRSTRVTVQQLASNATGELRRGHQLQATLGASLSPSVTASLAAGVQSRGFRTLTDTTLLWEDDHFIGREQTQLTGSFSWSGSTLGAFSASYSHQATFEGHARTRAGLGWSRMYGRTSVSLSMQRSIGGVVEQGGDSAYLSVSIPLGARATSRFYANTDDARGTRAGARVSQQLSDTLGYAVAAERNGNGKMDVSGRISLLPYYAQLDLGVSRRQDGSSSMDASLRGGIAFHRRGVTLSPYALRDTFAVMKLGEEGGIRINTPAGPVWTDARGLAIAPHLSAYRASRLEVGTETLPRNVDVGNGYKEIEAGRGSVHWLPFDVVAVRRMLLTAQMPDGQNVPKGSGVYDAQKRYVTTVLEGGKIFLADIEPDATLHVVRPDEGRCSLTFDLPMQADAEALFESASAQCR